VETAEATGKRPGRRHAITARLYMRCQVTWFAIGASPPGQARPLDHRNPWPQAAAASGSVLGRPTLPTSDQRAQGASPFLSSPLSERAQRQLRSTRRGHFRLKAGGQIAIRNAASPGLALLTLSNRRSCHRTRLLRVKAQSMPFARLRPLKLKVKGIASPPSRSGREIRSHTWVKRKRTHAAREFAALCRP